MPLPLPFENLARTFCETFASWINPGSVFSIQALLAALVVSVAFYAFKKPRKRAPTLGAWRRLLLPAKFLKSRSVKADFGYYLINTFFTGGLIGWGVLSLPQTSQSVCDVLDMRYGAHAPLIANPLLAHGVLTLALFLAYDFSYWLDHYLKHAIPVFWPFHRVHHTAELLTPFTAPRVHPIDTLIFINIQVLIVGAVNGALHAALGRTITSFTIGATNVLMVLFLFTVIHLQHSHIPIRFNGIWGRIFFSPAHHHIHHSSDPAHFGRNMGSCLAIWDTMFGTLLPPEQVSKALRFGAEGEGEDPHSLYGGLIFPFLQVLNLAKPGSADESDIGAPIPSS